LNHFQIILKNRWTTWATSASFDLAIRFGVPQDSSLIARPLAPNRRALCASPDYIARRGEPKDPVDLTRFDCIVLGTASGPVNEGSFTPGRGDPALHGAARDGPRDQ
jgi:DNA-binding transcriptional LysR family regulator